MKITALLGQMFLAVLLSSAFVCAQESREFPSTSGNAYLRLCSAIDKEDKDQTREDFRNVVSCVAYTEGVVQGVLAGAGLQRTTTGKEQPSPFCIPAEGDNAQMIRITLKYIRNNPEEAHKPSVALIIEALREALPCTGGHQGKVQ